MSKTAPPLGVENSRQAAAYIVANPPLFGHGNAALPIPAPDAQENAGLVAARQIASEQCASVTNVRIPDGGPLVMFTPAPDAQAVAVKVLAWRQPNAYLAEADGLFGFTYTLQRGFDGWFSLWGNSETYKSLEAAKAAAQQDYDQRIRSALAAPVTGEADVEAAKAEAFEEAAQIAKDYRERARVWNGNHDNWNGRKEAADWIEAAIRSRAKEKK
jgi:hypothetical protein